VAEQQELMLLLIGKLWRGVESDGANLELAKLARKYFFFFLEKNPSTSLEGDGYASNFHAMTRLLGDF
jgi:hypothetical protein